VQEALGVPPLALGLLPGAHVDGPVLGWTTRSRRLAVVVERTAIQHHVEVVGELIDRYIACTYVVIQLAGHACMRRTVYL
jgi:hypothetical protein